MKWFFAFTSVGIAVFAFLIGLKKTVRIPFGKILGGSLLMALTGLLTFRFLPSRQS